MSGRLHPSASALLAGAAMLAYYAARHLGLSTLVCEVLVAFPAAFAAFVLFRGARREKGGLRLFLFLVGSSAAIWVAGQLAWALAVVEGLRPELGYLKLVDFLFISFVVPALAAGLVGPGGGPIRADRTARLDAALLVSAVLLAFLRLILVPLVLFYRGRQGFQSVLLAVFCLVLTCVGVAQVALESDDGARRRHLLLALFAGAYGIGSGVANGLGVMPPPGSLLDLAWFIPFFSMAALARSGRSLAPPAPSTVLWFAGGLPLLVEIAVLLVWPEPIGRASRTLGMAAVAWLGLGCALRLRLAASATGSRDERPSVEEERRAKRLESLARIARPLLGDLRRTVDALDMRANAAATALAGEAGLVRDQVTRARLLTGEVEAALLRSPAPAPAPFEVRRLVERVLQSEVDAGLLLRFRVIAPRNLPPALADPLGLEAVVRELARNAAQSSPRGSLEVLLAREGDGLSVSFRDDGPGVPAEIRRHVFDPFFSTRRLGEGVGLGLTLVHFAMREMGGSVRIDPPEGRGTSIVLRVPSLPGPGRERLSQALLVLAAVLLLTVSVVYAAQAEAFIRLGLVVASGFAGWRLFRGGGADGAYGALVALGALLPGIGALSGALGLASLVDWPWSAAVLVAGTPGDATRRGRALRILLFGAFLAAHLLLVLRPSLPVADPAALSPLASAFLHLVLAAGAVATATRVETPGLQRGLHSLALALFLWAVGAVVLTWLPGLPPSHGRIRLPGFEVVLPLLLIGARARPPEYAGRPRPVTEESAVPEVVRRTAL